MLDGPFTAAMKPARFVIDGFAAIVDAAITRSLAVGERHKQVRQLRVAVLRQQPSHAVAPAAPAGFTDNCERRGAKVRSLIRSSMTNAGRSSWPIPTVSERSWARDVALEPRRSL